MMPPRYYTLQAPRMIAAGTANLDPLRKADIDHFANHCPETPELLRVFRTMVNNLFPVTRSTLDSTASRWEEQAEAIRRENGFDPVQHERLARRPPARADRPGKQSAARRPGRQRRRRLRPDRRARPHPEGRDRARAEAMIRRGEVAVVSLAAGVGSRWTTGAGVVKAINPFVTLGGVHRSFLEIHLAKTRAVQQALGRPHPPYRHHELPHPPGHRAPPGEHGELRARRPGPPLARPVDRPAADPDGPRPVVPLGGVDPRDARREQAEGSRGRSPRDPRMGASRRAKGPTTPTTSPPSGSIRRATSTRSPTCCATGCSPDPRRAPEPEMADGPQHRHPGGDGRSRRARPGRRGRREPELRGHPAADRRPRRRARAGRRPAPAARRARPAARGHRVRASATTTR